MEPRLRILCVSATWQGANDYAFVRAFRRLGHSVRVLSEAEYLPQWRARSMRGIRRLLQARIAGEFNDALVREARELRPDLLFVFKGPLVKAEALAAIRATGTVAIQFFPDVSVHNHGPWLPKALHQYDWIFTTKSFGPGDMARRLGISNTSFLPHAFDPETHVPQACDDRDREQYACDVSFIGNSSPKKLALINDVVSRLPDVNCRVWGPSSWSSSPAYQGQHVWGAEYAKAVGLSRINLGLLIEQQGGSSLGDQITSRTFSIPAAGGFMLHERTDEVRHYFDEDKEFVSFKDVDELVDKVRYFLKNDEERAMIANAGHERSLKSGYSMDNRAMQVIAKAREIAHENRYG